MLDGIIEIIKSLFKAICLLFFPFLIFEWRLCSISKNLGKENGNEKGKKEKKNILKINKLFYMLL